MSAPPDHFIPAQDAADAAQAWIVVDRMIRRGDLKASGVTIDVARAKEVLRVCEQQGFRPRPEGIAAAVRGILEAGGAGEVPG